ncbi:MAG: hypothetical protein WDN31_21465 [Hyphomicrobium sp.]
MVPALVAQLTDVSGLSLILFFVLPFGCFLLFVAIYQLIDTLLPGRLLLNLVIASAALVFFDPSRGIIQNNIFDKSALLAASPGLAYGAAALIWSVTQLLRGPTGFRHFLLVALTATVMMMAVRAHYMALLACILLLYKASELLEGQLRGPVALALAALAAIIAAYTFDIAYRSWLELTPATRDTYAFMQAFVWPSQIRLHGGAPTLLRPLLIMGWALGPALIVLVAIVFAVSWKAVDVRLWQTLQLLFVVLAGYYLALAASFVPDNGDPTEFTQRPFLVVNVLVAALALAGLVLATGRQVVFNVALGVVAVIELTVGRHFARPMGVPRDHAWNVNSYKLAVDRDLLSVAERLKRERPDAAFAFVPTRPKYFGFFPEAVISALSESPPYLSRLGVYLRSLKGQDLARLTARLAVVDALVECRAAQGQPKSDESVKLRYLIATSALPCHGAGERVGKYYLYRIADQTAD